jgi:type II secretory pathway pseudopilin PulG
LIELVVAIALLSLLAGAAAPLAVTQIRGHRIRVTQERMRQLIVGMVGDPTRGGYGYLGDLGALPAAITHLNNRDAQPLYVMDPTDGVGAGYNGPYAPRAGGAGTAFIDAWGTPFRYLGEAQLVSAGSDRQLDTADDIVFPEVPPTTTGNLIISVSGVPNDGESPCVLGEDDADVFVSSSIGGLRNETQLPGPIGAGGPFTGADLHRGLHGVRVVGQGDFAGATTRDVIEINGSATQLRVTLLQPAGSTAGCRPDGTPPDGTPPDDGNQNGNGNGNGNAGNNANENADDGSDNAADAGDNRNRNGRGNS